MEIDEARRRRIKFATARGLYGFLDSMGMLEAARKAYEYEIELFVANMVDVVENEISLVKK